MDAAAYQGRWRSRKRLKEIYARWRNLTKPEKTTETLMLACDTARLDRQFVKDELALTDVNVDAIEVPAADAGDE